MARFGDSSFRLGRITIERGSRIGGGAYGVVHRAKWQGVYVAVKILHEVFINTEVIGEGGRQTKIREFEGQIERLSLLHHPNLIQFFGVAEVDENSALVMELMEASLLERCVGDGREDNATLTRYLADVASGLRHLHDRSLVHRDLTLRNVLVGRGRAKLCDFGVSKVIDVDLAQQIRRATSHTMCPGTHLYMPAEAMVDNPKYDQSLDIFSLGILSVCVLTGHEPSLALIREPRVEAVIEAGRRVGRAIPEHTRRAVDFGRLSDDHALKPILLRCTANDPAARPGAAELQERFLETAELAKWVTTGSRAATLPESRLETLLEKVTTAIDRQATAQKEEFRSLEQRLASIEARSSKQELQLRQVGQAGFRAPTIPKCRLETLREQVTTAFDRQATAQKEAFRSLDKRLASIEARATPQQQPLGQLRRAISTGSDGSAYSSGTSLSSFPDFRHLRKAGGGTAISTGTAASAYSAGNSPSSLPDFRRLQKAAGGKWVQQQPVPIQGEAKNMWKAARINNTWYIAVSTTQERVAVLSTENFRSYEEINTDGVWWLHALAASEDELYVYAQRRIDGTRVLFKLVNGAFKAISPPNPVDQSFPGMSVKGDTILLVGGKNSEENITTCSVFLIHTHQWVCSHDSHPQCPAPLPRAVLSPYVICIDHKYYAVGGHLPSGNTTPILMLCDSTDVASSRATWQPVTEVPNTYNCCGVVAGHDCVVMAGGHQVEGKVFGTASSCRRIPSGALAELPDLPTGRQGPCLCLSGNELVCIGGLDKSNQSLSDVHVLTLPE